MRSLGIQIDDDLFFRVKMQALKRGLTLREYIMQLLEKDLREEIDKKE